MGEGGKMFLRNSFQQETSHMILDRTVFTSVFCGKKCSRSGCLTLCHPMDCSLPGSSIHGISQSRILEWVAISFSRESSRVRYQTWGSTLRADSLSSKPPGNPMDLKKKNSQNCFKSVFWFYAVQKKFGVSN